MLISEIWIMQLGLNLWKLNLNRQNPVISAVNPGEHHEAEGHLKLGHVMQLWEKLGLKLEENNNITALVLKIDANESELIQGIFQKAVS